MNENCEIKYRYEVRNL